MDRQNPYFTFQGFPVADVIFTRDPEKMYPQLNRTLISADFPKYKPHKNFQPFLKELGIKTEKDIVAKMHHWAPTSPLCLTFFNNSDGFLYYKIKVDRHDWIKLSRNFFKWDLNLGVNYLQVRTVSRKKIKGVVTFLKVKYGDPFSKVVK